MWTADNTYLTADNSCATADGTNNCILALMAHRAETIMAAVKTALTGLTTTGANVQRARVYELADADLPGLTINMGLDEIVETSTNNMAYIDRLLNIEVVAHVKANSAIDTTLNTIREEVHIAMYTDRKLGLSYVLDTMSAGDEKPELSGELDKASAQQVLNYVVHYRHSVGNPGA